MDCSRSQQTLLRNYSGDLRSQIFFLDPPDSQLNQFLLHPAPELPNLTRVDRPKVAPGTRLYPGYLGRWLERHWLTQFKRQSGVTIETIWLFENFRFYDFRLASARLKIYHQVDLNQRFHAETAATTADIC